MTVHRTMPSEVEPVTLADLIADCGALPEVLRTRVIDLRAVPAPRRATGYDVVIPEATTSLAEGYADYFV